MEISIIGHGYVGLVTACVFADFGNKVHVIGRTQDKINKLNSGDPLIYEPGLEEVLQRNLANGNISFSLSYDSIKNSQIVFIGVGTPSLPNGSADLSQVFDVAASIAENLGEDFTVVSCKSTVPIGTNKNIEKILQEKAPQNANFAVASCPEFLREGTGLTDTINPDRVVIGSASKKAIELLLDLHQPVGGERIVTDLASAEMIKYASNSMLATKISFANMIGEMSEIVGADAGVVLDAVGMDNRIGHKFLQVGLGYGGACFPKDVKALAYIGKSLGLKADLLDSVERINFSARDRFADKVSEVAPGKKLAIWGLSFKPNTDDVREAPSIHVLRKLLDAGYELSAYDPQAIEHIERQFGDKINFYDDKMKALDGAEALVILTEWSEFVGADLDEVKRVLQANNPDSKPTIIDGRNIYDLAQMEKLGFAYYSVGRRDVK